MSATEPLSPLDATFLELEDADPTAHMHIGGVLVFDALPGGGTPTLTRVRRHLERRLEALPRYRQRLSRRTTGGLRWPEWEVDDRFDIAAHVTVRRCPGRAESESCSPGLPTSGRIGSTVRGPSGAQCCSRDSPAGAGARHQDAPLPRGRRRLDRRGHGAARCRAEARTVEAADPDASRAGRRQRELAAPPGRHAGGGGGGDRGSGSPSATRRRGARRRARRRSSCSYARSSSPRHGRASTCSSASIAGWPSPRWRSRTSKRSSGRSAGRSTTSCSRSSRRAARAAPEARGGSARRGPAGDGAGRPSVQRPSTSSWKPHQLAVRPSSGRGGRAERPLSTGACADHEAQGQPPGRRREAARRSGWARAARAAQHRRARRCSPHGCST